MSILEEFKGHLSLLRRECRKADKTCLFTGFTFFVAGCFLGGTCLMYGALWIFTLLYFLIGISGFVLCCLYGFMIFTHKTSEELPLISRKNKRRERKKVSKRKLRKQLNFNCDRKEKTSNFPVNCNFSQTGNHSDLGNNLVLKKDKKSIAKGKVVGTCVKLNLNRLDSKCNEQYVTGATCQSDCSDGGQEEKERSRSEATNQLRKVINFLRRIFLRHSTSGVETENPSQQVEIRLEQFTESESKDNAFFHEKHEVSQDSVDFLGQDSRTNMRNEAKLPETALILDRTYEISPIIEENTMLLDSADYLQRDFRGYIRDNPGKRNKLSKNSSISEKCSENLQISYAQNSKFPEAQNFHSEIRYANQSGAERFRAPIFNRIRSYHDPPNLGENRDRSLTYLNSPMQVERTSPAMFFCNAKPPGLYKTCRHNENFSEVQDQNNAPSTDLKSTLSVPAWQRTSVYDEIYPFASICPILDNDENFLLENVESEILSADQPETCLESSNRHNHSPGKFDRTSQKSKDNFRETSFKSSFYNITSPERYLKQYLQFKRTFGYGNHSSSSKYGSFFDTKNHDEKESLDIYPAMNDKFENIHSNEGEIATFRYYRESANTVAYYGENREAALGSAATHSEHILPRPEKMSRKKILDKLWEEGRHLHGENLYKNEKVKPGKLQAEEMESMPLLYKKIYHSIPPVLERLFPNSSESHEPTMPSKSVMGSTIMEEEASSDRSPKERKLMFGHNSGYNNFLYFAELDEWDPEIFQRSEMLPNDATVPDEVPHHTLELKRECH